MEHLEVLKQHLFEISKLLHNIVILPRRTRKYKQMIDLVLAKLENRVILHQNDMTELLRLEKLAENVNTSLITMKADNKGIMSQVRFNLSAKKEKEELNFMMEQLGSKLAVFSFRQGTNHPILNEQEVVLFEEGNTRLEDHVVKDLQQEVDDNQMLNKSQSGAIPLGEDITRSIRIEPTTTKAKKKKKKLTHDEKKYLKTALSAVRPLSKNETKFLNKSVNKWGSIDLVYAYRLAGIMVKSVDDIDLYSKCAQAVKQLSVETSNRRVLVDAGIGELLMMGMRKYQSDYDIQEYGVWAFWNLSAEQDNHIVLQSMGLYDLLRDLITVNPDYIELHRACIIVLENLAVSEYTQSYLNTKGIMDLLAKSLKFGDKTHPEIVSACAGTMWNLTTSEKLQLEVTKSLSGIHKLIINQMTHFSSDRDVQRNSLGMLWNISIPKKNRKKLLKTELLNVLKDRLHEYSQDDEIMNLIVGILCNFTEGNRQCKAIVDMGLDTLIINHLEGVDMHVETKSNRKSSAESFFSRATHQTYGTETDVHEQVMRSKLVENCIGFMWNVSAIKEYRAGLLNQGVDNLVINAMKNYPNEYKLQDKGLGLMRNFSYDPGQRKILFDNDFGQIVMRTMNKFSHKRSIQEKGCGILWSFVKDEDPRAPLVMSGAAEYIVCAMQTYPDNRCVQLQGSGAIKCLMENEELCLLLECTGAQDALEDAEIAFPEINNLVHH